MREKPTGKKSDIRFCRRMDFHGKKKKIIHIRVRRGPTAYFPYVFRNEFLPTEPLLSLYVLHGSESGRMRDFKIKNNTRRRAL